MPTAVEKLLTQISSAQETAPESALRAMVNDVAANARDASLRSYLKKLLTNGGHLEVIQLHIISAGMFGLLPGAMTLQPSNGRVNSFLHKLRKAILGCKALDSVREENAKKYCFYPEFSGPVRQRIKAVALAHADMGPKNDELVVLYSLGGYFSEAKAATWNNGIGPQGGTTCVMTVRAIYQAAGVEMIGGKAPEVNTPGSIAVTLGVPTVKQQLTGQKVTLATVNRADFEQFKRFYEASKDGMPQVTPGDVYLLNADKDHPNLLRGVGVAAAHVGIVVNVNGDVWDTVDGGQENGDVVSLRANKKLKNGPTGWSFPPSPKDAKGFSDAELGLIQDFMKQYEGDKVDAYIATKPAMKANMDAAKANLKKYTEEKNEYLARRAKETINTLRETARSNARQVESSRHGSPRIISGWWKPEQYSQIYPVEISQIEKWLAVSKAA